MVDVTPQALRDHASNLVNGPISRVANAAEAAAQVRLGDADAYGIVFAQIIPPALDLFLEDAAGAIASADALGNAFAEALQDTAHQYENADQEVQALFEALLEGLDGAAS